MTRGIKRGLWVLAVFLTAVVSFIYGMLTVDLKVFPFKQIVRMRNAVLPGLDIKYKTEYYMQKKSFFDMHGRNMSFDVVMVGDSITDGAEWQELFPGIAIANRGVCGDTTKGILNRTDTIISTKASKAFIMVGINDFAVGRNVDDVFGDYVKIVKYMQKSGMHVFIQSTMFAGDAISYCNKDIRLLNAKLSDFAQKEGVEFIDLNAGLAPAGRLDAPYTNDDVHLTGEGYAIWSNIIRKYLE